MADKVAYAMEGIKRGIEKAQENIKIFEEAIQKEYDMIASLRNMQKEIIRKQAERESLVNDNPDELGN